MKPGVLLLGGAVLVGIVLLDDDTPTPSRLPSPTPVHTVPETARTAGEPAPLIIGSGSGTPLTFHGDVCTIDCSGHEAGYEWAENHGIDEPDDCGGNSESFIEGCRAYATEQRSESEDDGNEDNDADDANDED